MPLFLSFHISNALSSLVNSTFPNVLGFPLLSCISIAFTSIFFIPTTHHDLLQPSIGPLASIFVFLSFIPQNNLKNISTSYNIPPHNSFPLHAGWNLVDLAATDQPVYLKK